MTRSAATAVTTALSALALLWIIAVLARDDPSLTGAPLGMAAWWGLAVTLALQSAALLWSHHRATVTLGCAAGLSLVLAAVFPSGLFTVTALPVLVAAFLAGLTGLWRDVRWWALASGVLVAVAYVVNVRGAGHIGSPALTMQAVLQAGLVVGLPLLPASLIAAQRATRAAQREALAAATRERDAKVSEAIALERAAMARELHDIAAHHLSGISLMASVVARQTASAPGEARSGALLIRKQSNAILEDLRRLVGLLRDAGHGDEGVKTLDTLPGLIETARLTGARVDFDLRSDEQRDPGAGVSPLGQLAAYRMVQESLTNASRHAPGAPCAVTVDDRDPRRLRITVRNAPPGPQARPASRGTGYGIIGMRERAALIGGFFVAGPTGDDGWETRMSIPRESGHDLPERSA
ncbi:MULTISPECIES: histidine kinase [unclassified Streptomyces]|nr:MULTISPECIES: histidine kinase [unclassified Streptomyces]AEN13332.1 integral membrane sensor signal transduction histidine kinase [Streptomyces sp. SirexAA-E]MYR65222.1 sensor histidine kinase [Streptomyces sp. SID4939]MYT67217.1 sensor histidine kinase [Streptomyces sp. SID8357]MYT88097.1 sensor histidine kinase [Streptomyces sp. SID8360]MYW40783.1 sensor histidine kinase [Streptomyces sp. SID1]